MAAAQSLQTQLETSKKRVRMLVEDSMSMTQEVGRLEDSLGMSTKGAKQSSKDLPRRLSNLTTKLRSAAEHEKSIGEIERQLLHLQTKLQGADVETLYAKLREDQKVLAPCPLRLAPCALLLADASQSSTRPQTCLHSLQVLLQMSNTTIKGVQMVVHKLRGDVKTIEKALPPLPAHEPDPKTCWDIPRHVADRAAFSHSLVDSMIDTANLRKNLNDLTWELCKPGYGAADVAEYEAANNVSGKPPSQ